MQVSTLTSLGALIEIAQFEDVLLQERGLLEKKRI